MISRIAIKNSVSVFPNLEVRFRERFKNVFAGLSSVVFDVADDLGGWLEIAEPSFFVVVR